jgi:thymidylate synthase ThyX
MHQYVVEEFDEAESAILRRYFTNLDLPVFALVNLPEVVKGALFARYSRSSKSLRRLFLDEFVGDLDLTGDMTVDATVGLGRADDLYQRVFFEYGDDSVAQLGGVHLACEQSSNILTKVLEWGRLMSYLEQSTRYLGYDKRLANGHYRFYRDAAILESRYGARYVGEMDRMFDTYGELLRSMTEWLTGRFPKTPEDTDFAYRQAIRAKALDSVRGLLPASALSNVGIYGSGQGYEQLLLRMRAHPLDEVRRYSDLMLTELMKVIPSFLRRVEVEDRGVLWSRYLESTKNATGALVRSLTEGVEVPDPPLGVTLVDFDPNGETKIIEAILFSNATVSEGAASHVASALTDDQRRELFMSYVGERSNRRHRPGRAFERTGYRFELVTDYGAFRDLQRHRLLTAEWQPLSTDLGYEIPEIVDEAGFAEPYATSLERSRDLYETLSAELPDRAPYAVALAFRIRYSLQMNAREAMHVIELRSGPQGHPSYRRVAHEMHRQINEVAGHRLVAESMSYLDTSDIDLERLAAERAAERARDRARDG